MKNSCILMSVSEKFFVDADCKKNILHLCSKFFQRVDMIKECRLILMCSVRLYLQLFVGGLMFQLRYLCLFAYSAVQRILYCVFVFLRLVFPMLPVSLDCPFILLPLRYSLTFIALNCIEIKKEHCASDAKRFDFFLLDYEAV